MAEKPDNTDRGNDLKVLRGEMARTRSSLEEKLSELKSRFTTPRSTKRRTTMASKPKSTGSKTGKKAAAKKTAVLKSKPVQAAKKKAGTVMKKTKEVMGKMLEGAAVGAVKVAVEAVASKESSKKGSTKS